VPGTTATTAPVQVQSWLHSIIDEWNYKPTWAAEAEALKLAFEVGCTSFDHADVDSDNYYKRYLGLVGDLPQSTMTQGSILKISGAQNYADSPSLKFPQLVHFANEVEIAFSGRPGSPLIQSKMSEFGFSSWRNKPWAYRPTQSSVEVSHFLAANFDEIANRVLQSSAILPLSHLLPVQHRITDHHNAGPLSDRINDLPQLPFGILPAHGQFDQLPTFAQQILARTDETIIPFQNDWDLGVTTRTWFLHHFNEPRCDVFRMVQLTGDANTWLNQIWTAWHDKVVLGDRFVVHVVNPNPPRPVRDRHVAVDLILSQGLGSEDLSGLGTVWFSDDYAGDRHFSVAASLPPRLTGRDLVRRIDVEALCANHHCNLHHVSHDIPFTDDVSHHTLSGDSFVIVVQEIEPADMSEASDHEEDFNNDEHFDCPWDEPNTDMVQDDASVGYSPSQGLEFDATERIQVDTVEEVHRSPFLVHRLNHDSVHMYIRASTIEIATSEIASFLGIPIHEIVAVHFLAVTPVGDCPRTTSVILQCVGDLPPGSSERLVLLDVEIHLASHPQAAPPAPVPSRRVVRIVQFVLRQHMLIYANVDRYCIGQHDRCLVHLNHRLWGNGAPIELAPATYVRVNVPPSDDPRVPTLRAIEIAQVDPWAPSDNEDAGEANSVGSNLHQHGNSCSRRNQQRTLVQPTNQHALPDLTQFPPDGDNGWREVFEGLLNQHGTVEFLEEGPVIYVQSWFVNHMLHPVCDFPRSIKIDAFSAWVVP